MRCSRLLRSSFVLRPELIHVLYEPTSTISNQLRVSTPTSFLRLLQPTSGCPPSWRQLFHTHFTAAVLASLQPVYFVIPQRLVSQPSFSSQRYSNPIAFAVPSSSFKSLYRKRPTHQIVTAFSRGGASDTALRLLARVVESITSVWPVTRPQATVPCLP